MDDALPYRLESAMKRPEPRAALAGLSLTALGCLAQPAGLEAQSLPSGYWQPSEVRRILDKTVTLRLAPDLADLTAGEARAVEKLLQVGQILQRLHETSLHPQALAAREQLAALDRQLGSPAESQDLLKLYDLFQGPIAITPDNRREPFLPVDPHSPGKNVYPWKITQAEVERFLKAHPEERAAILHLRTVVRRAQPETLRQDLATLDRHPVLDTLHPGLKERLGRLLAGTTGNPEAGALYAVPYAVANADEILKIYGLLHEAAGAVESSDPDLARFLRHRSRDLLLDDYEAGDASWVTGDFGNLNVQLGAYEVYDDELFGVKAFFSLALLKRDRKTSEELRKALRGLQAFEDSLPYSAPKKVREDIPLGVYDVIADFGQARGTNGATNLPNESHISRKYGRIILMRANILKDPQLFALAQESWTTALDPRHHADLQVDAKFYYTLWHEIGHYLGPDLQKNGRDLYATFEENTSALEELKSDLIALYLARSLREQGYYDDARLRSVYASGIQRVLQSNRPRREEPYRVMMLMQMNYFLESGLLEFDPKSQLLRIRYERFHDTVAALLKEVLTLQYEGDKAASDRLIERYMTWRDDLHGVLAEKIRKNETYRYRLMRYAALPQP